MGGQRHAGARRRQAISRRSHFRGASPAWFSEPKLTAPRRSRTSSIFVARSIPMAVRLATPRAPKSEAERSSKLYIRAGEAAVGKERDRLLPKVDLLVHTLALNYCDNPRLQKMMEGIRDMVRWCQSTIILHLSEPLDLPCPSISRYARRSAPVNPSAPQPPCKRISKTPPNASRLFCARPAVARPERARDR